MNIDDIYHGYYKRECVKKIEKEQPHDQIIDKKDGQINFMMTKTDDLTLFSDSSNLMQIYKEFRTDPTLEYWSMDLNDQKDNRLVHKKSEIDKSC